ncbi:hypothetical protein PAE9249_01049 [Paenibacillus sp. CECT 9249]|nr:hypothetical protein PAE9249_01049 [Paenibacillus sp. CECT 9249]
MLLHITISSLFFFCSLFLGLKLAKHQKMVFERLESLLASRHQDHDSALVPAHYGLAKEALFPTIQVKDMTTGQMSALQLSGTKDTYILFALPGCKPCEETLEKMKMYNFSAFQFDLIVLTYTYPGVSDAEDKMAKHRQFLHALSLDRIYSVAAPEMKQLDITSFPSMMHIASDGKVIGTYTVDSEKLHLYFQEYPAARIAS